MKECHRCEIRGSHSSGDKDPRLLGCVHSVDWYIFTDVVEKRRATTIRVKQSTLRKNAEGLNLYYLYL